MRWTEGESDDDDEDEDEEEDDSTRLARDRPHARRRLERVRGDSPPGAQHEDEGGDRRDPKALSTPRSSPCVPPSTRPRRRRASTSGTTSRRCTPRMKIGSSRGSRSTPTTPTRGVRRHRTRVLFSSNRTNSCDFKKTATDPSTRRARRDARVCVMLATRTPSSSAPRLIFSSKSDRPLGSFTGSSPRGRLA